MAADDIALNPEIEENERALLHALLQSLDHGILMSDLERQDLIANHRLGELFSLSPQDLVETSPKAALALARTRFEDGEAFERRVEEIYSDPTLSCVDELELAGEPARTMRRYSGPVRDRDGRLIGRLWTFVDITETRQLQAAVQAQLRARTEDLATTSEVLRVMNDLCRLASVGSSQEALLTTLAHRVRPLLGFESSAVLLHVEETTLAGAACDLEGLTRPLQLPVREEPLLAAALAGALGGSALPLLVDASTGPVAQALGCPALAAVPLLSGGNAIGMLVLGSTRTPPALDRHRTIHLRAIADQIALTLDTHRLQAELHAAVETLRATQRQMLESEKLRTAGAVAASVAHDISNILTPLQFQLTRCADPAVEPIRTHLARFSTLTHRLLAFARPQALQIRPTLVLEVLQRILPLVAGQAQINEVEIVVRVPETLPPAAADQSQLEHLFVNLALNAIHSMAAAGGTLTFAGRATHSEVEIDVRDTGTGIAPECLERLFDPFFTTRANGLGLGLFSCKRIVEEHGGQLEAASLPGGGACFRVVLPRAREEG